MYNLCRRHSRSLFLFFFFLVLQVHARNSEFNLNLIDSGNCNRGSAIRTSNGHDMLHAFGRVVPDVLLIERTSFRNEIYPRAKPEISRFDCRYGVEKNLNFNFGFDESFDERYNFCADNKLHDIAIYFCGSVHSGLICDFIFSMNFVCTISLY